MDLALRRGGGRGDWSREMLDSIIPPSPSDPQQHIAHQQAY